MSRAVQRGLFITALLLNCLIGGCQVSLPPAAPPASALPAIDMPQIRPGASAQSLSSGKPYLECLHYDERGFIKAVEQAAPYPVQGRLLAAVSPHFLPVMSFTANILSTLVQEGGASPAIFVLAPNHSGEGLPLIVADRGWNTPFGPLEADEEATAALLKSPKLVGKIDVDLHHLESDHSAATLMPFIKYYLPQATVVTILITKGCSLADLEALSSLIYESGQDKEVFLLASIDFSHYLHIEETAARDVLTEELIGAGDMQAIKALDSGNLDSADAMVTLLSYIAHFSTARAELMDSVILPESKEAPYIGYSYKAYLFCAYD
jgi:AmmeMemoRadiSam system protein B